MAYSDSPSSPLEREDYSNSNTTGVFYPSSSTVESSPVQQQTTAQQPATTPVSTETESTEDGFLGQTEYLLIGILAGFLSIFTFAIFFTPITIVAGVQLYRNYDEVYGALVIGWALLPYLLFF